MRIRILCIGKLKERYLRDAAQEYVRRLTRYADVQIIELADEAIPEQYSKAECENAVQKEGMRILKHVRERDTVIALSIEGRSYSSTEFASAYQRWQQQGGAEAVFLIGGSCGLSPAVVARANAQLSLSRLTFPHQISRVLLLEQLYRAHKILQNEPYHK